MDIRNVKGGYDFLPEDQRMRNYITETLTAVFQRFGFKPIETSTLCYYDMLADKYDAENDILKEIYRLNDQGGRTLGLRYDLTVPFAKFIALNKNQIRFPFKRYEIAKVFRDGPVRVGRDREFTQCDVDVVGLSGQLIEAELMSLFVKAFNELCIDIRIKYNSRKLMTGLILEAGISAEFVPAVTTIIDKKDKVSATEFYRMLSEVDANIGDERIQNLMQWLNMPLNDLSNFFSVSGNVKLREGLDEVRALANYLNILGIANMCEFDSSLARGQNYYTGNVFEVYEKNGKVSGSIAAGGRYDTMIANFIGDGKEYPTVGISFGMSAIFELLKNRKVLPEESATEIYIIPMDTESECMTLAMRLRDMGYNVEMEMQKRKLKKSLDYANRERIPYVIIVGENEIANNQITVKDMFKNTSATINLKTLQGIEDTIP